MTILGNKEKSVYKPSKAEKLRLQKHWSYKHKKTQRTKSIRIDSTAPTNKPQTFNESSTLPNITNYAKVSEIDTSTIPYRTSGMKGLSQPINTCKFE